MLQTLPNFEKTTEIINHYRCLIDYDRFSFREPGLTSIDQNAHHTIP